jgi:hypothetical protein
MMLDNGIGVILNLGLIKTAYFSILKRFRFLDGDVKILIQRKIGSRPKLYTPPPKFQSAKEMEDIQTQLEILPKKSKTLVISKNAISGQLFKNFKYNSNRTTPDEGVV